MNRYQYFLPLLLSLSGMINLAHGASMSYGLNANNIGLDSTIDWGTVTISDGTAGDIDFMVTLNHEAFIELGNFGMQDFFFNSAIDISVANITFNDPVEWNFQSDRLYNAGGGFGKFGLEYAGTGSVRADPLSFTISALGDDIMTYVLENDEGYIFATHIADFDGPGDTTSGKFSTTSAVPLPAAAWLFGSALIGFVGFARRRSV